MNSSPANCSFSANWRRPLRPHHAFTPGSPTSIGTRSRSCTMHLLNRRTAKRQLEYCAGLLRNIRASDREGSHFRGRTSGRDRKHGRTFSRRGDCAEGAVSECGKGGSGRGIPPLPRDPRGCLLRGSAQSSLRIPRSGTVAPWTTRLRGKIWQRSNLGWGDADHRAVHRPSIM